MDIDPQAVEVTKLSLLLKVLEGESEQTISSQLKMFQERALPDLDYNIKCGNSLIGPDFYNGSVGSLVPAQKKGQQQKLPLHDDEERLRINVFDWQAEFPDIFPSPSMGEGRGEGVGGFDAVIGNPPYVRQEATGKFEILFSTAYIILPQGMADLYVIFIRAGCIAA